jgi:hypothetical protein
VQIAGSSLRIGVGPVPVEGSDEPPDAAMVGVQLDVAGRPVWRTFAARRVDEVPRPVTGTVLVGSAPARGASDGGEQDADPVDGVAGLDGLDEIGDEVENRPRAVVHLVGGDGFAQRSALDLLDAGVGEVRLLVRGDEPLMPGVEAVEGLTVVRCPSEVQAAEALGAQPGGDEAILVVEGTGERAFDTEKLLERLSIVRLHAAEASPVPALYVCCRGDERLRRLRNFVVDKVIDVTWVESSYFTVLASVYFDLMRDHEELARWSTERQLALADRVASRLCHLAVWRPGDESPDTLDSRPEPGRPGGTAPLARPGRAGPPVPGRSARVLRFRVEPDDDDDTTPPVVRADVTVPPKDEPLAPRDLLVALRYL